MAEPGVGKSRLFFEFKATTQSVWMVLETFSVSHGKASAYLPVIDLLRNYFRIANEDDERTRREKVAGRIAILDRNLEDTLPYPFSLLGIVEGDNPLAQMAEFRGLLGHVGLSVTGVTPTAGTLSIASRYSSANDQKEKDYGSFTYVGSSSGNTDECFRHLCERAWPGRLFEREVCRDR